jgi:hypothetical protein
LAGRFTLSGKKKTVEDAKTELSQSIQQYLNDHKMVKPEVREYFDQEFPTLIGRMQSNLVPEIPLETFEAAIYKKALAKRTNKFFGLTHKYAKPFNKFHYEDSLCPKGSILYSDFLKGLHQEIKKELRNKKNCSDSIVVLNQFMQSWCGHQEQQLKDDIKTLFSIAQGQTPLPPSTTAQGQTPPPSTTAQGQTPPPSTTIPASARPPQTKTAQILNSTKNQGHQGPGAPKT